MSGIHHVTRHFPEKHLIRGLLHAHAGPAPCEKTVNFDDRGRINLYYGTSRARPAPS